MYRDIDSQLVARDADRARVQCPACRLENRPSAARCVCGYDLAREHEDPAERFRAELRRSARSLLRIGALCLSPWLLVAWNAVTLADAPWLHSPFVLYVSTVTGLAFILGGLQRWPASR